MEGLAATLHGLRERGANADRPAGRSTRHAQRPPATHHHYDPSPFSTTAPSQVGEAFRYQAPGMVIPSYLLAFAYVCGDARDKGMRASNAGGSGVYATVDCFVW